MPKEIYLACNNDAYCKKFVRCIFVKIKNVYKSFKQTGITTNQTNSQAMSIELFHWLIIENNWIQLNYWCLIAKHNWTSTKHEKFAKFRLFGIQKESHNRSFAPVYIFLRNRWQLAGKKGYGACLENFCFVDILRKTVC